MGQFGVVLGQSIGVKHLDRPAHRTMKFLAPLQEEAVIGDILDDRMLEDVGGLRQQTLFVDNFERLQLLQQALEFSGETGHPLQQSHHELAANNGSYLHRALAVGAEAVEPRHDDALNRIRERSPGRRFSPSGSDRSRER